MKAPESSPFEFDKSTYYVILLKLSKVESKATHATELSGTLYAKEEMRKKKKENNKMIKPIHLRWPAKCHRVTDELLSTYIFIGKKKSQNESSLEKLLYIYIYKECNFFFTFFKLKTLLWAIRIP